MGRSRTLQRTSSASHMVPAASCTTRVRHMYVHNTSPMQPPTHISRTHPDPASSALHALPSYLALIPAEYPCRTLAVPLLYARPAFMPCVVPAVLVRP